MDCGPNHLPKVIPRNRNLRNETERPFQPRSSSPNEPATFLNPSGISPLAVLTPVRYRRGRLHCTKAQRRHSTPPMSAAFFHAIAYRGFPPLAVTRHIAILSGGGITRPLRRTQQFCLSAPLLFPEILRLTLTRPAVNPSGVSPSGRSSPRSLFSSEWRREHMT